jgi:hypothetical protein
MGLCSGDLRGHLAKIGESEQVGFTLQRPSPPSVSLSAAGGFFSNYFAPCSEPIFEVATVFIAPFRVKLICTGTNYVLGQFEGGDICNLISHGTPSVGVL